MRQKTPLHRAAFLNSKQNSVGPASLASPGQELLSRSKDPCDHPEPAQIAQNSVPTLQSPLCHVK